MTEAEELELLELEEEEALARDAAPQSLADNVRGKAVSALAGVGQGLSFGLMDEYEAAKKAAMATGMEAISEGGRRGLGDVLRRGLQNYRTARTGERAAVEKARQDNPKTFLSSELGAAIALPIPGAGLAKAGSAGLRLLKNVGQGSGVGATYAGGASEADLTKLIDGAPGEGVAELKRFLTDIGWGGSIGAGAGLVGGGIGHGLERLRGKAKAGIERAVADQVAERAKDIAKDQASKRGAVGQKAADILQSRRVAKEAAEELAEIDPDFAELLRKKASDPAALARLRKAAGTYAQRLDRGLDDLTGLEADLAASLARNAETEAAEKLAHPIRNEIAPRLRTMANRAVPIAIGSAVGGPAGVVAGSAAGAMMGRPGTILSNLVKAPAVRKLGYEALDATLGGLVQPTTRAAQKASQSVAPMRQARPPLIHIQFDPVTGRAVDSPGPQASRAGDVRMVDADGKTYDVPEADVPDMERAGLRRVTQN